ncbi:unnamed protein product [Caenorhabditis auriculariae]|uniref:Galectin n=1 Tax=Caenorhabditis auriculariae TaxID=2777116 RepID=A0A8S1H941_9PELO|nr:unnamed protein product [Caenorhabditis auriculariae]
MKLPIILLIVFQLARASTNYRCTQLQNTVQNQHVSLETPLQVGDEIVLEGIFSKNADKFTFHLYEGSQPGGSISLRITNRNGQSTEYNSFENGVWGKPIFGSQLAATGQTFMFTIRVHPYYYEILRRDQPTVIFPYQVKATKVQAIGIENIEFRSITKCFPEFMGKRTNEKEQILIGLGMVQVLYDDPRLVNRG